MGCGVAREAEVAAHGTSDEHKAAVFTRLVSEDRNPLAEQLSRYFRNLVTECKYRSQGDEAGYQRMLDIRKTCVVVTPTSRRALADGIGKEPLTARSVYSIVELFLGHAMLALGKERWEGSFNYRIEKQEAAAVQEANLSRDSPPRPIVAATAAAAAEGTATSSSGLTNRTSFSAGGSGGGLAAKPSPRDERSMLVATNNRVVARGPVGVEGFLDLTAVIEYPTIDRRHALRTDAEIRYEFFLLEGDDEKKTV